MYARSFPSSTASGPQKTRQHDTHVRRKVSPTIIRNRLHENKAGRPGGAQQAYEKDTIMQQLTSFLIRIYQAALSPILPFNHCRFYPSCSDYAIEAVEKHGVGRGLLLGGKRLLRCHPFHKAGGYDPVPETKTLRQEG